MPCDRSSTVSASGQRVRRNRSRKSSRSASGISIRKGMISALIAATSPRVLAVGRVQLLFVATTPRSGTQFEPSGIGGAIQHRRHEQQHQARGAEWEHAECEEAASGRKSQTEARYYLEHA